MTTRPRGREVGIEETPTNYTPTVTGAASPIDATRLDAHLLGIDAALALFSSQTVQVSAADTTPGFLNNELAAGALLTATIVDPAADESLRLDWGGALAAVSAAVTDANLIPEARIVTAGDGLTGGGDLSADRTFNVVANADGSIVANADDIQVGVLATDGQHGDRGNGSLHAEATTDARGFVELAEQAEVNAGTSTTLVITPATLAGTSLAFTPVAHAASHQNGGGDEIDVGGLSGLLADAQTPLGHASSHLPSGGDGLTTGVPSDIGTINAEGSAEAFPRLDHIHNHPAFTSHAADATIHFIVASIDHGAIAGRADDDHSGYLWSLGRALGQTQIGGTGAGEEYTILGSSDPNLGQIRIQSPIDFDDVLAAVALNPFYIQAKPSVTVTADYNAGAMNMSPIITWSSPVFFVWAGLQASPVITTGGVPALFAAFTLFQALPSMVAGSVATHNPTSAVALNYGCRFINDYSGTRTTISSTCAQAGATVEATLSGGTMNLTDQRGVTMWPRFSVVTGAFVNLGTVVGLPCLEPTVKAFGGSSSGTKTMDAYIGVDYEAMTFGGDVPKVVVRSALAAASQAYFINHTGGAQSRHEGEFHFDEYLIHVDDVDTYVQFTDDQIDLVAGGVAMLRLDETTQPVVQVNPASTDVDFEVYGDTGLLVQTDAAIDGLGFFAATPVAKPPSLTAALTQITHTGPTTPDYALATPIDSGVGSAWGYSTQDEFETAASVVLNLQTRLDQLESRIQSLGLLT